MADILIPEITQSDGGRLVQILSKSGFVCKAKKSGYAHTKEVFCERDGDRLWWLRLAPKPRR